MLTVTKIFEFDYAHRLPGYEGPCKNLHGHRARLEIEVKGHNELRDTPDGMVMDFNHMKDMVQTLVLRRMDHSFINDFIENPTAENMVKWIVNELGPPLGDKLCRVRLYETPNSFCEWRAP